MTQKRVRKQKVAGTSLQATRAAIYLRVSTDEQVKYGYGLSSQLEQCQNYCKAHGLEVVAIEKDEGLSGTLSIAERAGLVAILTLATIGQIDYIISYAQDRYARDTGVWASVRKAASKAGVHLITVKENQDFTSREAQFMGDIHAAVAAEERRTITDRLYGGRRQRAMRDGKGSGSTPYGYVKVMEVVGNEVKARIETDEAARPIITLIITCRRSGMSYSAIAEQLNELGYEKPKGGQWSFGNVQQITLLDKLYTTGIRQWDNVVASEQWPILVEV